MCLHSHHLWQALIYLFVFHTFPFMSTFLTCVITSFYCQELSRKAINTPLPCFTHVSLTEGAVHNAENQTRHPSSSPSFTSLQWLCEAIPTSSPCSTFSSSDLTQSDVYKELFTSLACWTTHYPFKHKYTHAQLWDGHTKDKTMWEMGGGNVRFLATGQNSSLINLPFLVLTFFPESLI